MSKRALLEPALAAYAKGDPAPFLALIDDDVQFETMAKSDFFPFGGEARGKARLVEVIGMIAQDWQCLQFKLATWIEQDPWVAFRAETRFRDVHNGNKVDLDFGVFCRFENGRIVQYREFWDSHKAYETSLGPLPGRARQASPCCS
jgi:ketosteroid isomerase-like protein